MFARLLWSSLRARRARLALAMFAVTLGVAVATALATLALQVGDDLARALRAAGPNFVVLPIGARLPLDLGGAELEPARAGVHLAESAVSSLKAGFWKNNVLDAAPELVVDAAVGGAPAPLVGTWFEHAPLASSAEWRTGLATLRPNWKIEGRWPGEATGTALELALGRDLAGRIS